MGPPQFRFNDLESGKASVSIGVSYLFGLLWKKELFAGAYITIGI